MGILATAGNIYFVYSFLKRLVTPFNKTKAFELGIIDENGKVLRRKSQLKTEEERDAYTLSDRLVWNLKRLIEKIPLGKTRLASFAAALYLLKEQNNPDILMDEDKLEQLFMDYLDAIQNDTISENYYSNIKDTTVVDLLRAYDESEGKFELFAPLAEKYTGFDFETLNEELSLNQLPFTDELDTLFEQVIDEDTPVTTTGGGAIAYRDIPLGNPPKTLKRKMFAGKDVFVVEPKFFDKARTGKRKYHKYKDYVGEDEAGQYIRAYARTYPKKAIIVMDSSTGAMQYLRHGK